MWTWRLDSNPSFQCLTVQPRAGHLKVISPSLAVRKAQTLISLKSVSPQTSQNAIWHTPATKCLHWDRWGFRERSWKEISKVVTEEEKQKKGIMPNFRSSQFGLCGRETAKRGRSFWYQENICMVTRCSGDSWSEHLIAPWSLPKWDC